MFKITDSRASALALASGLCGALWAMAPSGAAVAQTAPGAATPAASSDEIVITAQKRNEAAVNVPISVTAVSGTTLQQSGVGSTSSLGDVVPGLHIDSSGAFFMPSIRGVGTAVAGAGASSNVASYVDGIYHPDALSNDFNFIDVQSIQVLKGPQGTLFGRNATGGAILVTTREPSFDEHLEVRVGYGSFDTFTGAMYATDKLTDRLAVSVAVGGEESSGWVNNRATTSSANPISDLAGRVKFLYQPNSDWSATLTLNAYRIDDPTSYAAASYHGFSAAANYSVPLSIDTPREVALSGAIAHWSYGEGFNLKVVGDLGWATLTSYTSAQWSRGHEATNELAALFPVNGTTPTNPSAPLGGTMITFAQWWYRQQTFSQEFDLSHSGGALDWATGLYFFSDTTTYSPFVLSAYGPLGAGGVYGEFDYNPFNAYTGLAKSIAAFADATYNWNNWHFTAGARYSVDQAGIKYKNYSVPTFGQPESPTLTDDHNFYSLTPRAVVRYSLTDNSNIYLSWSKGQKAGLYNASGYFSQRDPVQPEEVEATELGYKISGHRWSFDTAAFYYDYTNLQVATYVGATSILQNAPSAEIYGADMHWRDRLTDNFTADLSLNYTHARYVEFKNAAFQTFNSTLGAVINSTRDVSNGIMQRTPEYSGALGLTYDHDWGGGNLELNANYSYRAKTSFDFANTLRQPAYGLLNLRAAWTDPAQKWTFAISGDNVTDEAYLVQVLPNAGGFGAIYGEPASVMFQISYSH